MSAVAGGAPDIFVQGAHPPEKNDDGMTIDEEYLNSLDPDDVLTPLGEATIEDAMSGAEIEGNLEVPQSSLDRAWNGAYGQIFEAILHTDDGQQRAVAVKVFGRQTKTTVTVKRLRKRLAREIYFWKRLDHPNVVPFIGICPEEKFRGLPGMVMPWYANGTVLDYVDKKKKPYADRFSLIQDVAAGLAYLHTRSPTIIHGDMKANNVLVDNEGHARLTDFGIARAIGAGPTGLTTSSNESPVRFVAPELVLGDDSPVKTLATDIWAFACTIYEILTLRVPYYESNGNHVIMRKIITGVKCQFVDKTKKPISDTPQWMIDWLGQRWAIDPAERGSMADLARELAGRNADGSLRE